jgi:hypothetical protein
MRLTTFFPYYGGKVRLAKFYPAPVGGIIVEPFAGSAGYSLLYHDRVIRLYDLDPIVCSVWDYLIRAKSSEIRSLPDLVSGVDGLPIPQEAKWLIGYWLGPGSAAPRLNGSVWHKQRMGRQVSSYWCTRVRESWCGMVAVSAANKTLG